MGKQEQRKALKEEVLEEHSQRDKCSQVYASMRTLRESLEQAIEAGDIKTAQGKVRELEVIENSLNSFAQEEDPDAQEVFPISLRSSLIKAVEKDYTEIVSEILLVSRSTKPPTNLSGIPLVLYAYDLRNPDSSGEVFVTANMDMANAILDCVPTAIDNARFRERSHQCKKY